jgi:hypothetical protein
MPIDLDLLRHSETLEQVLRWQTLRYPTTNPRPLLECILETDRKLRQTQREIQASRHQLKLWQRSLAPHNVTVILDVMERKRDIQGLKEQVTEKEQIIHQLHETLSIHLSQVANAVDEGIWQMQDVTRYASPKPSPIRNPLFCIQGYEQLPVQCLPPTTTLLTGVGASLERALSNHLLTLLPDATLVSFPTDMIQVSSALVRDLLGCPVDPETRQAPSPVTTTTTTTTTMNTTTASALVGLSLLHSSKTYFDRQFPLQHMCLSRGPDHNGERLHVVCVTGCTMTESQASQRELLLVMKRSYTSLLLNSTTHQGFQLSPVASPELLPHEVSRVVLTDPDGTLLGYVSNMTDYVSRGTNTRCGSLERSHVHIVHACWSCIPEMLDFMVRRNVVVEQGEWGVGVPGGVARGMREFVGDTWGEWAFLPCQRRVEANNGKVSTSGIPHASTPRWIHTITGTANGSKSLDSKVEARKEPFAIEHNGIVTREEIQGESLMSPFSFLPLL